MEKFNEFPVIIYGQAERYNDVLNKARVRIFYRGANRNGTYISDEFAEKLIASLPYVPVKGIFDGEGADFTDHGEERDEGRIYGIVPENPNFAWEKHLDEDGVEREYACADILIFTALYQEANMIIGKAQSMEIYRPSIQYHYEIIDSQKYFVFDEGCFLGLQVLGDSVEPCFEGASFFSLQQSINDVVDKLRKISAEFDLKEESSNMQINFKLSDSQKFNAIWSLLNPNYTEAGNWTVEYDISEVYDDYALAHNYETGENVRVYYKKNEDDTICISEIKKVAIMDITDDEYAVIQAIRAINGDTFEAVSENISKAADNSAAVAELNSKNAELEASVATLNSEKADLEEQVKSANQSVETLNSTVNELQTYKLANETAKKEAILEQYAGHLSDEVLDTYREKIATYECDALDKDLAYELKKISMDMFAKKDTNGLIPKDQPASGIVAILSHYKK